MKDPRQTKWRLLAFLVVPFALWAFAAPASSQTTSSSGAAPASVPPDDLIPEIAVLVDGLDDQTRSALAQRLGDIGSVGRITAEGFDDGSAVFYLSRSNSQIGRSIDGITEEARMVVSETSPDSEVLVGGSAVVDALLINRFADTSLVLVLVAALAGLATGVVFGWARGALAGATMALAVYAAGGIGTEVGGRFDGTVATTVLPGALAGLVVSATLSLRLLVWFRHPDGADGAEMIRRSVASLVPELALLFSGLVFSAVLVELLDPGRSPLTVVAVAGILAAVVTLAVLAAGLTLLAAEPERSPHRLPLSFPDGRDLSLAAVVAVGLVLAALSVFVFNSPSSDLLFSEDLAEDVPAEIEAAAVTATLQSSGGDSTNAVIVAKPEPVSAADFADWVAAIVERPDIERADTASARFTSTGRVELDDGVGLVPADLGQVAAIVLTSSPRSEAGQAALSNLVATPIGGVQPQLATEPTASFELVGSTTTIVVAIVALALAAAIGIQILTQNVGQAMVAFLIRLLGGGAAVGLFHLVAGNATMAELLTVLAVMASAVALVETEFVQLSTAATASSSSPARPQANPGQFAALGMALLAVAGAVMAATILLVGGPGTGRFGLGLLAAVIVELLIGVLLLRPALLGQRAAFHTAVRPVRVALHSGSEPEPTSSGAYQDPSWRRTVGDLLQAEFRFQSHPTDADLDSVFVRDTPLFRQAEAHHRNLADAGLRIVGRSPRLRSLKTVSGRSPVTLTVTVDHPERNLIDREGTVVGVRKSERRSGVLWLSEDPDGSYRIAESVELSSVPLPDEAPEVLDVDLGLGHDPEALKAAEQPINP